MLGGLIKRKFYKKCKLATQLTKTRLDMIMKKRNAMQRYFKNDIAELLKNGLDRNAYGRAEGILVEQNLTYCYEFVEKFIEQISNNVSIMDKESECPEDCREAASSLIFAAARFADLPDLRNLRNMFKDRYGTSLDFHVNKEFVDRLKLAPPTKDMKLQLLQDIAEESGVQWNRDDAEKNLFNHLPLESKQGANIATDDKSQARRNAYDSPKNRTPFGNISRGGRKEVAKENLEEGDILQDKPLPSPPYRRTYLDLTRNNDERVGNNGGESDDKKLTENPVRKSNAKPISARKVHSKIMNNEDDVGVSSTRKEEDSLLIRHRSCDDNSTSEDPSLGQQDTKERHIRSCSDLPEKSRKLPDYDDLVAHFAAMREGH